jgi:amino acid transporter
MKDIPRSIVIILLILVIVISVLGTWTVLDEVGKTKSTTYTQPTATGKVKLNIIAPEEREPSQTTGKVILNIGGNENG